MPELRWALIGLGVLFIAGLALWEWRRNRRRHQQAVAEAAAGVAPQPGGESWQGRRIEPRIDSLGPDLPAHADAPIDDVPVIHPTAGGPAEVSLRVAPEAAVDVPSAAGAAHPADAIADAGAPITEEPAAAGVAATAHEPVEEAPAQEPQPAAAAAEIRAAKGPVEIRWPPERADRVLMLRLTSAQGALLPGRAVRLALEQAGLVHGPQRIYHRVADDGSVLVSAANMLRPGDLDPAVMDEQQFRGLSLFSVLPGAMSPVRMLEELVAVARAVAWRLGAVVQDEHGEELDGERLVKLRQSLPDEPEHGTA
jgi:hypothetical protein